MLLTKEIRFEAAHALANLKPGHKCMNVHGHNYVVGVELFGEPDEDTGMIVDFGTLKKVIMDKYDHALLLHQDHPLVSIMLLQGKSFAEKTKASCADEKAYRAVDAWAATQKMVVLDCSPTAENLAELIRKDLAAACGEKVVVSRVTVYENETSHATAHISQEEAHARS